MSAPLSVLVTGASGFIGRHAVAALHAAGHRVVAADLRPFPGAAVETVVGDLREARVREAALTAGVDAVLHLAAMTSVLGSLEAPARVHEVNVEVTAALVELARVRGVGAFAMASTNAVVGDVGDATIVEGAALAPLTPYGATKAAGEMLLLGYSGAYGLRAPLLRLTNVYGAGMAHKDSFVPRLMRAASSGGGVQVYGDGEQRRDLVHVGDVARAMVAAVTGWPSGPVIIGGARSWTVNDIVAAARRATGAPIPVTHVAAVAGEMPAVVVDTARARSRGFSATTSLDDGLRDAWADLRAASPAAAVAAGG